MKTILRRSGSGIRPAIIEYVDVTWRAKIALIRWSKIPLLMLRKDAHGYYDYKS
jgi:hypothetical protein